MKTRERHSNNKRTEIERFDWFVERIQNVRGFWLVKRTLENTRELSRNQSILRFDVILQHDWVFFGGKTKSPCFDLSIHWLIKQITNTFRNHFSRSYENRANAIYYIDTSVLLENIPLLKFINTTSGTRVVYFP